MRTQNRCMGAMHGVQCRLPWQRRLTKAAGAVVGDARSTLCLDLGGVLGQDGCLQVGSGNRWR